LLLSLLGLGEGVHAQAVFEDMAGRMGKETLNLPYAFYNDSFGAAVGYVSGVVGYPQRQSALLGTVMAGTKGSAMGFLIGRDIRIPHTRRLFLDPVVSLGYFVDNKAFINGKPRFSDQRAGSNSSNKDNFVKGDGVDMFYRAKFKYLLPIGTGRDTVVSTYVMDEGLPVSGASGGRSLNPLDSGKTYLELRPFYRSQTIDGSDTDNTTRTNGADLAVFWDNRDFFPNPTRGNGLRLRVSRDFGLFDSSNSWTNLDAELDAYVPLSLWGGLRQQVLALDLWTSYSPTWEQQGDGTIDNRPPAYTGSTLGGLWRMRGYPSQRFNDKAAVYYAAELRIIPDWNPFERWPQIQKYVGVQWLQLVPFVEVGRVAPEWSFENLHSSMKWDAGVGLRVWARGLVARIDTAVSEEGFGMQMMVSQPFQF